EPTAAAQAQAGRDSSRGAKKSLGDPGDLPGRSSPGRRERRMSAAEQVAREVGTAPACRALGVCRATLYRRRRAATVATAADPRAPHPRASVRALGTAEQEQVSEVLHAGRFVDASPAQIYATLLDEGRFLCSERTMYRLLARHGELRERRNQLQHPTY